MRKALTIITFLLITIQTINAQFIVYEEDEGTTPYTDYQIFETHSLDLSLLGTLFDYRIKNTGTAPIEIRIHVDSVINSNGDAEFCYNNMCTHPVLQGYTYPDPSENDHIIIQPGQLQPYASVAKFANITPGIDPTKPVDYVFKFYQIDSQGNEIGTPLHVRCRYTSPSMSINPQTTNHNILVYPNPASDIVTINSESNISEINIIDITGKVIKRQSMLNDENTIDVSSFVPGFYFIAFYDENKLIARQKLIIK